MAIIYDKKTLDRARRKAHRREWISTKSKKASEWMREHEEDLKIAAPICAVATTAIAKAISYTAKKNRLNKERELKDLYCYDRSLGHYWKLRRELTNDEWIAIDKRKKDGERLADILSELKVLK